MRFFLETTILGPVRSTRRNRRLLVFIDHIPITVEQQAAIELFSWVVVLNPPATMSSGVPLMYKVGFSLEWVHVRHIMYHCDALRMILRVVHFIPNSDTTIWPPCPPKPSSELSTSGWRYMKAVHGTTPWTYIRSRKYYAWFMKFQTGILLHDFFFY